MIFWRMWLIRGSQERSPHRLVEELGDKVQLQREMTTAGVVDSMTDTDSDQQQAEQPTGRAPLATNKTPQRRGRKRGSPGITRLHLALVVQMV